MNRTIEITANTVDDKIIAVRVYDDDVPATTIFASKVSGAGNCLDITPVNTAIVYL